MKIVADSVNGCEYLTAGKEYTVLQEHSSEHNSGQRYFDILSDTGPRITICFKNCPHIQSDWRIVEDETDAEALAEISRIGQELQPEMYEITDEEEEAWRMKEEQQYDMVNNPKHYQLLPGVQVKDVRKAILDKIPEGVPYNQIDDWSRAWEYVTRMWDKNGLEDAKKARVYLDWLIEEMEGKK